MKMVRILARALALALATPAIAQSPGNFPSGYMYGNAGASSGQPKPTSATQWFDRWCSSTNNGVPARLSGSWTCLASANNSVWATNGSGVPALTTTLPNAVQDNITRLGTIASAGAPIGAAFGGTGLSSYTIGDMLYASGATTFSKLAAGTSGYAVMANGAGVAPSYQGFLQTGTGAGTRTWQSKAADAVSIIDFQAVSGGSTATNNAALAAAQATTHTKFFVPEGTYATTLDPDAASASTGLVGPYEGPGKITTSGNQRAPFFINQNVGFSGSAANVGFLIGSPTTWGEGLWTYAGLAIEKRLTAPLIAVPANTTTTALTAAGNNLVRLTSVAGLYVGLNIHDVTHSSVIPIYTSITAINQGGDPANSVRISANVTGGGIVSGDTINFGYGQYWQPEQAAPISIRYYAKNGTLTRDDRAGIMNAVPFNINVFNDTDGGGIGGIWFQSQVTRGWSGFVNTAPSQTTVVGNIGGTMTAGADNVFMQHSEVLLSDGGKVATVIHTANDMLRTGAPSVANPNSYWISYKHSAAGSTTPVDVGESFSGPFVTAIDTTPATISGSAILLKANQKISLNGVAGTYGPPSSQGTEYIQWSSVNSGIQFVVGGTATLDLRAANGFFQGSSFALALNDTSGAGSATLVFQSNTTTKWSIAKAADNTLHFTDVATPSERMVLTTSGVEFTGSIKTDGSTGTSATKTVRASGGAADCSLIFTNGVLTGGTC